MSTGIRDMMIDAYRNIADNPREARFILRMQRVFRRSERRRAKHTKNLGINIPPFLIASIATTCNLQCKGCYARQNGIAADTPQRPTLNPEQWHAIFSEAADLGVSFALLAGGEPLTQRHLLESIASIDDIIFPVFTNGTLIGAQYLAFFRQHLNMIPIISIEGDDEATDQRRGKGVFQRALFSMQLLHNEGLIFGASITVTTANLDAVTSPDYLQRLHSLGCKIVIYVEYVPVDEHTAHLALADQHVAHMERTLDQRRTDTPGMLFLSFPGDEKEVDGCIAAGRGFFHIGPDGAAEPCPFSPYSDTNVAQVGLRGALASPLFRRIRDARALGWEHTGGCTLFEHREEVEAMLADATASEAAPLPHNDSTATA